MDMSPYPCPMRFSKEGESDLSIPNWLLALAIVVFLIVQFLELISLVRP